MLSVVVAVVLAVVYGRDAALAGMAGGGIGLVLTALAALRAGAAAASGEPARMVAAFYRAMAMKLVVAVVLFTVVARWFAPWFGPVLIGYVATLAAYWVALLRMGRKAPPARNG
ncbi:ATP synthase subunit I [Halomonas denitrificans]|nr:ATP synthase subunit I [Halomonas denitrificans]